MHPLAKVRSLDTDTATMICTAHDDLEMVGLYRFMFRTIKLVVRNYPQLEFREVAQSSGIVVEREMPFRSGKVVFTKMPSLAKGEACSQESVPCIGIRVFESEFFITQALAQDRDFNRAEVGMARVLSTPPKTSEPLVFSTFRDISRRISIVLQEVLCVLGLHKQGLNGTTVWVVNAACHPDCPG